MIEIDLAEMLPAELLAYPDLIAMLVPDIVEAMRSDIVRSAQAALLTTGDDYLQGLQPAQYHFRGNRLPEGDVIVATLVLVGVLPNMVENGAPSWDMKPGLLAGRNSRAVKGGGRMAVVPFRHGTPGSSGRHFPPMGQAQVASMGEAAAHKLGKRVHAAAKLLSPTTTDPGWSTKWGGRLEAGMAPLLASHHKTDIYAGMVRQVKQYGKREQSQYTTFRAVSSRSDPRAWIHPGIEARHFFGQAAARSDAIVGPLLAQAMAGLAKGRA